ncbi:BLUF domain-containing protein [Dyella ginsengisoli]|uniref:BLUF domain-containing protein n=1 Tax=Dyella ginsengisoli TaxID=363848 RepID=UPI000C201EF7|nr:BLUF domain-containing protein [Dyella ginsengisoli]
MSDIQQLVYASRATFQPSNNGGGVEPAVARILMQSRRNNPRRDLVGALYYGDGCFFQCLEGPGAAIDELFGRLLADPRHRDVKVLRRQAIGAPSFADWSMKYVPAASDVQTLLAMHGKGRFDPYDFDDSLLEAMVGLLHRRADADSLNPVSIPAPAAAAGTGARVQPGRSWLVPALLAIAAAAAVAWWLR